MAQPSVPDAFNSLLTTGRIGPDDVLQLRRGVFADGVVSRDEADWVFALNDVCEGTSAEWPAFFVEALTDYTVHQATPQGYVSEENARWLIERIGKGGVVKGETELELLIKVMEASQASPESLVAYALGQVKIAVVHGDGPVARGGQLSPGKVGEAEVDLLRRMLYAFGGDGNIAITRQEADILFDINDATMGADNHPAWPDLFVKAIANHLMAAHGYSVPTRQEALRRAEWLDDTASGVDRFIVKALAGGLKGIWQAYRQPDGWESHLARKERAIFEAEPVIDSEAQWLAGRINRNGRMCDNERALLAFIAEESRSIDPVLKPLIEKAGIAA